MNATIAGAIQSKVVLQFWYNGSQRMAEPHCYGIDTKGHEALRAYQIEKGWRLFHVSDITGLSKTDQKFLGPRPQYSRNDSHMKQIFAQL